MWIKNVLLVPAAVTGVSNFSYHCATQGHSWSETSIQMRSLYTNGLLYKIVTAGITANVVI